MKIKDIINFVDSNGLVKDFLFKNPEGYFVHIFHMFGTDEWQMGYFFENNVHVFIYDEKLKTVLQNPGEEAFKEPDKKILELSPEDIKIDYEDALAIAEKEVSEKYKDAPSKKFMVIQNIENLGPIYNFTMITDSYKTINIKISTKTGEILSSNIFNIFDLARKEGN